MGPRKEWLINKCLSLHFLANTCSMHEQEIGTKDSSCSKMTRKNYLLLQHDIVTINVFEIVKKSNDLICAIEYSSKQAVIIVVGNGFIWHTHLAHPPKNKFQLKYF